MQSRYYNPTWGRFINADVFVSTGQGSLSNNMFTYCLNNPVILQDPTGTVTVAAVVAPAAYEAFIAFLTSVAASNAWNAIGWAAAAILATGIITLGTMYLYEWFLTEQSEEISIEHQEDVGGFASPPGNGDDDDWDDDYYNNESNFGGRERMGKQKGQTPRDNQKQNQQFKDATKGLSKDKRQKLHHEIGGQGLGFKGLCERAKDFIFFIYALFDEDE